MAADDSRRLHNTKSSRPSSGSVNKFNIYLELVLQSPSLLSLRKKPGVTNFARVVNLTLVNEKYYGIGINDITNKVA